MLEPDTRVVLLDQLRPPPGYRLHAAVATTFTLDLTTAVIPPLAFTSFEIRGTPDPVAALEAVRACTDRVDLFCQAGQILVPAQHSDLMAYLEPMVHPVRRPRPGFLFHPKVWFLAYRAADDGVDAEPDRYRLLCASRNLTHSSAWDAAVTLNGVRGTRPRATNTPLSAFLRHLPSFAVRALSPERGSRVEALAQAARYVEWELPEHVDEITFHVFGIPRARRTADFSGYRSLVVSPFCNDAGLAHLIDGSPDVTLVSRPETIDRLAPETLASVQTRVLDPLAMLGNPDDDPANSAGGNRRGGAQAEIDTLHGLHAKLTVVERARRAHLFIGSPNATSAAYGGNVEFAVELSGGASKLGVAGLLDADSGFGSLLMTYASDGGGRPEPDEELLDRLRGVLRGLAEVPFTLTVHPAKDGHDLVLTSEQPIRAPAGYEVRAELLTGPGAACGLAPDAVADATFPAVPLADITPFVVLRTRDTEHSTPSQPLELSSVVHAALVGDPSDRLDAVLARQVDTPEKFLRFLALLCGMTDEGSILSWSNDGRSGDGDWGVGVGGGVFELLTNALAERPESLRDLDTLVRRLLGTEAGRAVLPPGFEAVWEPVMEALARIEGGPS